MDDQGSVGVTERRPSFVGDTEALLARAGEGLKDDAESLVDHVFGAGSAATAEGVFTGAVTVAEGAGGAAVAAIRALGAAHLNFGQLSLTAELSAVKASIENGIVALARHIAGLTNAG